MADSKVRTTTVGELIAALQQFPSDMPILATWEGITRSIDVLGVKDKSVGWDISEPTVILDVDQW